MFLNPQFLYGLAGISVPVLIHLLARRRARRLLFPSLRLLKEAEKKRRRLSRLRRPLSLLLRCLAIALLALALATPVVGPIPGWLPLPRPQALVIVLDDSLSMSGWQEGESPFSRARRVAQRLLSTLGSADRVAMLPTSSPDEATWRSPARAGEWLATRQPTALSAKLAPALVRAGALLSQVDAPNQGVVILTDLQAAAWRDPPVSGDKLTSTRVVVVDVGSKQGRNLSADGLEVLTAAPLLGRPVRLAAVAGVTSAGERPERPAKVVVQLRVGGEPVAASEQEVVPDAPAAAQFSLLPDAARDIAASVALTGGPHGISADDFRYCTVRVRPSLRVVVVTPSATGPGAYLSAALNPFGEVGRTGILPEVRPPSELTAALAPGPADVVVLANCPPTDEGTEKALKSHLAAGGGVLVFLGDAIDARYYQERLLPQLTGSPGPSIGPALVAESGAPFFLSEVSTSREPLALFANPRAGDLGSLHFAKMRQIEPPSDTDVLASFDNGIPALLQWQTGRGRVILFNASADDSWGDHVRSPAYVPLLHVLCVYLARSTRPIIADVIVGERPAIAATEEPPAQVTVVDPRGEERPAPVEDGLLPEVNEPGAYRVRWGEHEVGFAANVESTESDLTRTASQAIRSALAPTQVQTMVGESSLAQVKAALPTRADLSRPLLVLALALVLLESVFSIVRREPREASSSRLTASRQP